MVKFDSKNQKHVELATSQVFSHSNSLPILDLYGYILERNGEQMVLWQDYPNRHRYPSIFLPKDPRNWTHASIVFATKEDVERVKSEGIEIAEQKPAGIEYYFATKDFVEPKGSLGKKVRKFERDHAYKVLNAYPKETIRAFFDEWQKQPDRPQDKVRSDMSDPLDFDHFFFDYCLDHLDEYGIKQVYVEIDRKLAGMAWGVASHVPDKWVGLHMKALRDYPGLSRFLFCERAKLFADRAEFSTSTGCDKPGMDAFKQELGPSRTSEYFTIETKGKTS
jgi:hypothetical protein